MKSTSKKQGYIQDKNNASWNTQGYSPNVDAKGTMREAYNLANQQLAFSNQLGRENAREAASYTLRRDTQQQGHEMRLAGMNNQPQRQQSQLQGDKIEAARSRLMNNRSPQMSRMGGGGGTPGVATAPSPKQMMEMEYRLGKARGQDELRNSIDLKNRDFSMDMQRAGMNQRHERDLAVMNASTQKEVAAMNSSAQIASSMAGNYRYNYW